MVDLIKLFRPAILNQNNGETCFQSLNFFLDFNVFVRFASEPGCPHTNSDISLDLTDQHGEERLRQVSPPEIE